MASRLFVFVQMEFPWELGPADGRYVLRGERDGEPEQVVVFDSLSAPRASLRSRLGSRAAPEASAEPAAVRTTRVTVIDPVSLSAELQARTWLDELDREREIEVALATVNRVVHLHRIAAADAGVHEVTAEQALIVRAGWGEGEQVASGAWRHARELQLQKQKRIGLRARPGGGRARSAALRPQERLAALLAARSDELMCEELTLRARQDLDYGRLAHAALELDLALAAAVGELRAEGRQDLAIRTAELEQLHDGVAAQAALARPGERSREDGEPPLERDVIAHGLERLEAALRARSAAGFNVS